MEETLLLEMAQADRQHSTIGIIMFDIDRFKQFNDTFGHKGGDLVLQDFGDLLTAHVREGDIACRYGGEEFVIIMPGANQDNTFHRAEQIRKEFDKMIALRTGEMSFQITLSAGVVIYPIHARDRDGILNLADRALYQAKNQGRNKTVIYQNVSLSKQGGF
jgi:diguanylate cyclase (GGDEF)-like protein